LPSRAMVLSNGVPIDGYFPRGTEEAAWKSGALGCDPCEGGGCGGVCGIDNNNNTQRPGELQNVNWTFVGQTAGAYDKVQTFNFVGTGAGCYEKEEVFTEYGWKVKPHCLGLAMMAIIVSLMLLLLFSWPTQTSTTTNFNLAIGKTAWDGAA